MEKLGRSACQEPANIPFDYTGGFGQTLTNFWWFGTSDFGTDFNKFGNKGDLLYPYCK